MGFKNLFKQLESNAEKLMNGENPNDSVLAIQDEGFDTVGEDYEVEFEHSENPTRWEKAVVALNGMVKQVSQVDPDGVDMVCFGGVDEGEEEDDSEEEEEEGKKKKKKKKSKISIFRGVKNIKDVETMVKSKIPGGPCHMGKAMDYVLKEAFDRGFEKRPTSILVLTAGKPDDAKRLEQSLQTAAEKIAALKVKEAPIGVTFVHVGDDPDADKFLQHLADNMVSHKKSKKTGEVVDIVDTITYKEINDAMDELAGNKGKDGKTGAIIGAFAGAAMGVGGLYMYNRHQAKKRTRGWNGKWRATYEGCEIAKLTITDDLKGNLYIKGFPGGPTTGKYAEHKKKAYSITFRDADEHWRITGDIQDEHTIFWSDGTRWDEIPPKGAKWTHFAGAAAAGAASGGAVGYLLDKRFFAKCTKNKESDYVIMVDRSGMMAIKDKRTTLTKFGEDDEDDDIEVFTASTTSRPNSNKNFVQSATDKFNSLSTNEKVAVGVAGAAAVAGVTAAGVGIAHAVKASKADDNTDENAPVAVATARAIESTPPPKKYRGGLNGKWRATFDGDTLAMLDVEDDLQGILTIEGFLGGKTVGKYVRNAHNKQVQKIHFIDADENWPVGGEVKGSRETVIMWTDGTRWDKVA